MSELHFAEPQWVHLLWAVVVYVCLMTWLELRQSAALERFAGASLLSRLVRRPSGAQRAARLVLLGAAGTFMTLALMRPQWGLELVATPRAGAEIIICLDVSNSMLAEDVAPNRLGRAKAEIRDLLELLDGDQVGLIAFAGRASVLSPLTPDFGFLRLVLDTAGAGSVTLGGTRLEEPIRKAVNGFAATGDISRAIILITDGEDHDSFPLEAAKAAAQRGIRILAIGFGDERGAEIRVTDPATNAQTLLKHADGTPVRTRLDGELLRAMALATAGAYIPAGTGVLDLQSIYRAHIAPLTRGQLDGQTRAVRADAYPWALLLGLFSLLAALAVTLRGAAGPGIAGFAAALILSAAPPELRAEAATPRESFNAGLTATQSQGWEEAFSKFESARNAAATDGELRYRATYSLGWTAAQQADGLMESEPKAALAKLEESAVWFREALALQPGADDARYNLELVERRIIELTDTLEEKSEQDVRTALEALISRQRGVLTEVARAAAAARAADEPNATRAARRLHRALSASALGVIEDARSLAKRTNREVESLSAKPQDERAADASVRLASLTQAIGHIHTAQAKLNQARRQLRRLETVSAFHRGADALDALKRALDQLLDQVERIAALLQQTRGLLELTGRYAHGRRTLEDPPPTLQWLTSSHLSERQAKLHDRTAELGARFYSALADYAETNKAPGENALAHERLRTQLEQATPRLLAAAEWFRQAQAHLETDASAQALTAQGEGFVDLQFAREVFLDVRRLTDLVYETETPLIEALKPGAGDRFAPRELAAPHQRNVDRMTRLGRLISDSLALGASASTLSKPEQQRLEVGYELWREANAKMQTVQAGLRDDKAKVEAGTAAIAHLKDLQRLFYSLLEHLKETVHHQTELNDETERLAATGDKAAQRTGPLSARQGALAETASALGDALEEQSESTGEPMNGIRDAARLVTTASATMENAAKSLREAPADLSGSRTDQDTALSKLVEAVALLEPPQPDQSPQRPSEQDDQPQGPSTQPGGAEMAQLLQGVRDREAQRQRNRADRRTGYAPVERNW